MKHFVSARQRTNRRNDASAGFSLIEMLAALAIAGAMFAVIAEFTGRTLRNWQHGEGTIAVMEMITRGLGRLETDLSSAVPMSPPGGDSSVLYFAGDATQLRFVAATGFGAGNHGLELLSIATSTDHDDLLLVRQRGPVLNPPAQLSDPVVLLRGRIQLRFSYRDSAGQTSPNWVNRGDLPAAVLVAILAQDGTPVFPSAFVLPIPVNLGIDCLAGGEQAQEAPQHCGDTSNNPPAQANAPPQGQPAPQDGK